MADLPTREEIEESQRICERFDRYEPEEFNAHARTALPERNRQVLDLLEEIRANLDARGRIMTADEAILVFELDYLRRRCEIQERLIAAWRDFAMCRTSSSNPIVMTREAEADRKIQVCQNELAELDKEHGLGAIHGGRQRRRLGRFDG